MADDLTGAAELGAIGFRRGLRAKVVLRDGKLDAADLLCLDTDSRACTAEEAASRAGDAAARLRRAGASMVFKKTDSLLRGQVTPEVEAVMNVLGLSRALLLPMNPSRGRTVQDGKYLVNGQPIHETEFARDPGFPRHSARVTDLVQAPARMRLMVLAPSEALPAEGICVGEAATSEDVRQWARRRDKDTLAAGGAEFFAASLEALGMTTSPTAPEPLKLRENRALFVSGSASNACRHFCAAARVAGVPVFSLPPRLAVAGELTADEAAQLAAEIVAALSPSRQVVLSVGLPLIGDPRRSATLASALVSVAAEVLHRAAVDAVYAEGGATAVELATRMGWSNLEVAGELCPGVAVLRCEQPREMRFIVKPGSYVWPETVLPGPAEPDGNEALEPAWPEAARFQAADPSSALKPKEC